MKRLRVLSLLISFMYFFPCVAQAQIRGPVSTYADLLSAAETAEDGDTILISGTLEAEETIPFSPKNRISVSSAEGETAVLMGLHLINADMSFSNIALDNTLIIEGISKVILASNVTVSGDHESAVLFNGSGEFIVDPSCSITGSNGAAGVSIHHSGGNLYAALEGTVTGGSGNIGGAGVTVSPLNNEGLLLIGGTVSGGDGLDIGGNGVNLYDVSGNAYISLTGTAHGGSGLIGGDGLQIISITGTSNIGIIGEIEGGTGAEYGGSGLFLMNAEGSSAVTLSGHLYGGNTTSSNSEPGQSLLLVGNGGINHMLDGECYLKDGEIIEIDPVSDVFLADTDEKQNSELILSDLSNLSESLMEEEENDAALAWQDTEESVEPDDYELPILAAAETAPDSTVIADSDDGTELPQSSSAASEPAASIDISEDFHESEEKNISSAETATEEDNISSVEIAIEENGAPSPEILAEENSISSVEIVADENSIFSSEIASEMDELASTDADEDVSEEYAEEPPSAPESQSNHIRANRLIPVGLAEAEEAAAPETSKTALETSDESENTENAASESLLVPPGLPSEQVNSEEAEESELEETDKFLESDITETAADETASRVPDSQN